MRFVAIWTTALAGVPVAKGMHVKIKGRKELRDKLAKLPKKLKAAEVRAVKGQTEASADRLRKEAPVLTGDLKKSIQEEVRNGGMTGIVAITDPDAAEIIHGTSDTPAHDFVTSTINYTRRQFPRRVNKELKRELGGGK